ncbi:TlyA family rRNA (cytidine-2'-O)-methyltransferase [Luteimicrobium xylanilyticum]|uniref:23S rRNA (Cytidine(1920)-2'-O)-methyltransferase n=1 Tax=Luteimicrobium xylanilyticum TaxID=1133546 RepID=A0A5P9Q9Y9_9MICO|nr:TlyA family RNA methyltransferase [Luteimicrobium xylanilyticum]QFU98066.1 23S rRNA (cytidine(1920)-2'-O)-methyltransferase [Luteimicrobium xylanilyticum]
MAARLDAELVRRGLARSRREAAALVAAGRVRVGGATVTRPAARADGDLEVDRPAGDAGWASRAAHKLEGALAALDAAGIEVPVADAACLDLGASTGGFTDVLLRRGARRVVAVDVGHDQLVDRLRTDDRVDVREGVNARDLEKADLGEPPAVVVGDLSFISLGHVLPAVGRVAAADGSALLLVKPQFEVGRDRLGAGGVVRSPALREDAVLGVAEAAARSGWTVRAVVPSALPGPHGNREFFLLLVRPASVLGRAPGGPDEPSPGLRDAVRAAVAARVEPATDDWSAPPTPTAYAVGTELDHDDNDEGVGA